MRQGRTKGPPRVCHFGGYARDYSRNIVLRKALKRRGVEYVECHSRHPSKVWRCVELVSGYLAVYRCVDVLLAGTVCHYYMPLAHLLGRLTRKPIVFDAFDSLNETIVQDFQTAAPGGLSARWSATVDRVACALADLVILDTPQHAAFFADTLGVPQEKLRSLPVGADTDLFFPRNAHLAGDGTTVLFVGTYTYVHGVDTIVRAAARLGTCDAIRFVLVGTGPTHRLTCQLAESLGVRNVSFLPRAPYDSLPGLMSRADIVLGVFGDVPKTQLVVPNKVYESMAMGQTLITGDTTAVRAVLTHDREAILSPLGDDAALAESILRLHREPATRARLGKAAYERFRRSFSFEGIGERLEEVLAEAVHGGKA